MWMGGLPPLGYDVKDKKLVVNKPEAERVRYIYRKYAELGSVLALNEELDRDGIRSKCRVDKFGRTFGDKPITRGALYLMLQNRLYRGEVVHKDTAYPGEHPAIVDESLWETVQAKLSANRVARMIGAQAEAPSLLAGLLYDDAGLRMSPTHTNKKGKRFRYYVSQQLIKGRRGAAPLGRRLPAGEVEALVENRLNTFLKAEGEVFSAIEPVIAENSESSGLADQAAKLAERWTQLPSSERRRILLTLLARVDIHRERVEIHTRIPGLLAILRGEITSPDRPHDNEKPDSRVITWTIPVRLQRTGIEKRMLIDGASDTARRVPDHSLSRLMAQAHQYQEMLMRGNGMTMTQLATKAGVTRSYFSRILRVSFLAPEIVTLILKNHHPIGLTAKHLANHIHLPISWEAQKALLGVS